MGIIYYEEDKIFKLDTPESSYIIAIADKEQFVGHVYYGKRLKYHDVSYLMRLNEPPFVPSLNNRDRLSFYDSFPSEYSVHGLGDFRSSCLEVLTPGGHTACSLHYESHKIIAGKPELEGLPATFGNAADCTTLEIACRDPVLHLAVVLIYTVFEKINAISRSVRIRNEGDQFLYLTKALSLCVDFEGIDYDMITLHGSWARERHIQRLPVGYGKNSTSSVRGESGHQDNPFLALVSKSASENSGEVFGFNFVYSGNFIAQTEGCQFDITRVVMGINPTGFQWKLEPCEVFTAPEAVMVYSDQGIGKMTRAFHDLYRGHLIRGKYADSQRPVLINSWEAAYFDIDSDKLLNLAAKAASLGIEMFVLDDGWFGKRESDNSSLGDWVVNEDKIKGGLPELVNRINNLGMAFGIWIEPEMVSPDSDLYRAHPDWAIRIPERTPGLCRNQYVLDLSRIEIRDYLYASIKKILKSANITYVKWDMNRQLCDMGSSSLPADRQGELYHRYVLGVYDLMGRLTSDFPDLLLETCSGGGARFDPGMLYFGPQIWCSDDTDAIERLSIQQGTAMVYPLSSIGAHVSDCPNHTVGRITPFETRGLVALAGTFGYELDVTKISGQDQSQIPEQIALYHKYNDLIRRGDYYRIAGYIENHEYDCWQIVSKDKSETLITYIQVTQRPNFHSRRIRVKGLEASSFYHDTVTGEVFSGEALMFGGLPVLGLYGDCRGKLFHFAKEPVTAKSDDEGDI